MFYLLTNFPVVTIEYKWIIPDDKIAFIEGLCCYFAAGAVLQWGLQTVSMEQLSQDAVYADNNY